MAYQIIGFGSETVLGAIALSTVIVKAFTDDNSREHINHKFSLIIEWNKMIDSSNKVIFIVGDGKKKLKITRKQLQLYKEDQLK